MSNTEERSVAAIDATNARTFDELCSHLRDSDVASIIATATYDLQSQKSLIHTQYLVRQAKADRQRTTNEEIPEEKIRNLSESFTRKYPELLKFFNEWESLRLELIEILTQAQLSLKRNLFLESYFRIITSAADIFGTLCRYSGSPEWLVKLVNNPLVENASICGLVAHFAERFASKRIHSDIDEAIKKDQECFQKIIKWFEQTRELDEAVRDFFPYGIDKDIVKIINARCNTIDDYQKMFIAIVLSTGKKNPKLIEDFDFLRKADCFASSVVGKLWFEKEILEDEPYFSYACNSTLYEEIQGCNAKIKLEQENMKDKETQQQNVGTKENTLEGLKIMLASSVKIKVILNLITIGNILLKKEPQELSSLRKLTRSTSEEREKIEKIVNLLNPARLRMISISTDV